jgi:hypothetical protein
MTASEAIQPLNVAGATIIIQLLILGGIAIASNLVNTSSDRYHAIYFGRSEVNYWQMISLPLFIVFIVSIIVLMLSDTMYGLVWGPFFQGIGLNTISTNTSVSIVFVTDLILISHLIYITGGSDESPYTSMLLTIPALAIFLRLSSSTFIYLAVFSSFIYLLLLWISKSSNSHVKTVSARAFINIFCLFLSMLTGYITKPIPMEEMAKINSEAPHNAKEKN